MEIMKSFIASWKSTAAGIAAILIAVISASQDASLQAMALDPKVQIALVVGLLGLVAKDGNVTGGTTGQPSTPEALHAANQAVSTVNPPSQE